MFYLRSKYVAEHKSGKGGHLLLIKCYELNNRRTTLCVRWTKSRVVSKGPYQTWKAKELISPNIFYINEVSTLKLRPPSENIEDIEDGELRNAACIMRLGGRAGCPRQPLEAGPRHAAMMGGPVQCWSWCVEPPVGAVSTLPVPGGGDPEPRPATTASPSPLIADASTDKQENVSNSWCHRISRKESSPFQYFFVKKLILLELYHIPLYSKMHDEIKKHVSV